MTTRFSRRRPRVRRRAADADQPRPLRPAHRRRGLLGAMVVAAAVLLAALPGAAATGNPTTAGTVPTDPAMPDPSGPHLPDAPSLTVTRQDNWIGPRGTFHLEVRVTAPSDGYVLEARLFQAVDGVAAVLATGTNPPTTRLIDRLGRNSLPAGSSVQRFEVPVVPEADGTFGDPYVLDPGVYPIELRLLGPERDVAATVVTHLVHLPRALLTAPVAVGVVADLRAAPERTSEGRAKLSGGTAGRLQTQLEALAGFAGLPVSIQLHPETVSALTDTRAGIGGPSLAALLRLAGTGQGGTGAAEILGGTYVGFDEAQWIADQHHDVVGAELDAGAVSLTGATLRNRRDTAALYGPTETDVLARLAEYGITRVVSAPSAGGVGADVALGPGPGPVQERPAQLLLPTPPVGVLPAQGPETGELTVVDAHRVLAALLVAAINGDDAAQQLRLGPTVDLDGAFASVVLGALVDGGPLRPVRVGQLFDDPDLHTGAVTVGTQRTPPGGSTPRSDALGTTNLRVNGLRSLLGDDTAAAGLQARLLLVPADTLGERAAMAIVEGVEAAIATVTQRVVVPDSQAFTTTAHETSIPLVIRNETDQALHVALELRSGELEFTGPNPLTVTLQPGPNDLEIPIKTGRSGEFDFEVRVLSADMALTLGDIEVRVQSRAISGVGLFLSAGALLFLVVWWFRNARRRRRLRRLGPGSPEPADRADDRPVAEDPAVANSPHTRPPTPRHHARGVARPEPVEDTPVIDGSRS